MEPNRQNLDYDMASDPDHLSPEERAELDALMEAKMKAKKMGITLENYDDPTVEAFMRGKILKEAGIAISAEEGYEEKHELSESEAAQILGTLKQRSEDGKNSTLCLGLDWERVERALRADPERLWSAHQAENAGHEPTIFQADKTGFWFGTMAKETPESSRDCVYDEEAAEPLRSKFPDLRSAVESAEEMGFELMTEDQGNHIAKNTPIYRENGGSWYKTGSDTRDAGSAVAGLRNGDHLAVVQFNAASHFVDRGWRGARRVNYFW